jgi:MFS family permease
MASTHILSPLRHAAVARIWSALAFSALGDQLYIVALGFVAVEAFGPAAGYLSALRWAVMLVAASLGGSLADRWNIRWSMVGADVARAAILVVLVVAWTVAGAPSAWLLALVIIVLALGEAVFEPALQAFVPALVSDRRLLVSTNGLFDATDRLARLLGPGLIALAASAIPVLHFFSLDAASFFVSALAVASVADVDETRLTPFAAPSGLRASLARGVAAIRREPLLAYSFEVKSVTNGVWYAVFFLVLPLVILREHIVKADGAALAAYGLVISCYGVSNLGANLVVGSLPLPDRPAPRVLAGMLTTGIGILLMAGACWAPLPQALRLPALAAASCVSGFGGPLQDITLASLRQTLIPAKDIAPATRSLLMMTCVGALAGLLVTPVLVEIFGPIGVMALGGVIYVASVIYGRLKRAVWRQPAHGREGG